jgi:hypothetical protein
MLAKIVDGAGHEIQGIKRLGAGGLAGRLDMLLDRA